MEAVKVLGIAPYEELNRSMKSVSQEFPEVTADVYTADLVEGQHLAKAHYLEDYDVIISRGGTAKLIREVVDIPVIDVSLSIYDILSAIRLAENYTENFTIVGYPSITEKAHLVCDLLGYKIEIHTIDEAYGPAVALDLLAEKNYELVLCDAITNRIAQEKALNTILITSGFESVKSAFKEAQSIAAYLNQEKTKKEILRKGILCQSQEILLLNAAQEIEFGNLTPDLTRELVDYLKTRHFEEGAYEYYSPTEKTFFTLTLVSYTIAETPYYSCAVIRHPAPPAVNKLDIDYQRKAEVGEALAKNLIFNQFIPSSVKEVLKKSDKHYHSYLIFGESGTAKKNIAYHLYQNQQQNNNYLITIDCKRFNERLWKFLVNPTNGPFVDNHNTIFFENIEALEPTTLRRLIALIEDASVAKQNNLIFTYDVSLSDDSAKFELLVKKMSLAKIYAPALKERRAELNIITTLLLNKMNIECGKDVLGFDPKALEAFLAFDWPGNFTQLQDGIKELVINAETHYISEHQVTELINKEKIIESFSSLKVQKFSSKNTLHQPTLFDYTKEIILNILEQNGGNQTKTATQLGISRTTLWRYLKESE